MSRNITFSRLGKYGRLGNQCFQVAGTWGLARKHGLEFKLPRWKYSKYFNPVFSDGSTGGIRLDEKHFHHHGWAIPPRGDIDVTGYLQSEKYWSEYGCPLKLRAGFVRSIRIKNQQLLSKKCIGIQIRRGDYVNNPNYTQLSIGWFVSALQKHFPEWRSCNLVIFSDDVDYCQTHFGCLDNAHFTSELNDIECIGLMSQMQGMIISNSSFGWWGAFFAEQNYGAKIVRPSRHVEGKLAAKSDIKDLYPMRWAVHDVGSKIDLTDCTFTIPVSYDHPDREENLSLCLNALKRDFHTKVLIQEQSWNKLKFEHFRKHDENVIGFLHLHDQKFHRTKMLNQMARHATTDIVANWDADVLIPPVQILMAVMALRDGMQMVFPYDGRFARVPRKPWLKRIRDTDIGIVGKTVFAGMTERFASVGGAVMFRRADFLAHGGENERFISYGPEDVERAERFPRLGFKHTRIKGPLYHINHYVGVNSSNKNPFFAAGQRELERVRGLSDKALKNEFFVG